MCRLLLLIILETTVQVHSKYFPCVGNTFHSQNNKRKCRTCKPCAVGNEYNISYVRQKNENGFLNCPPCVPCRDNFYRKDVTQPACYICSLDCQASNRYSSQRCGGSSQGHCGECITGYVSISKEPNEMCLQGKPSWSVSPSAFSEDRPLNLRNGSQNVTQSSFESKKGKDLEINILPLIVVTPLLIVVLVTVVIVCVSLERRKKVSIKELCYAETATQTPLNSNRDLISNTRSTILDVEHDGLELVTLVKPETVHTVRACHSNSAKINARIPNAALDPFLKGDGHQRLAIPSVRLTKDDKYITYVARKVSGKRRYEFFRHLKIEEAKYQPEEELWEKNKQSFGDYILNVLKIWITIADKNATLHVLCSCLHQAGFQHVVNDLLTLCKEPEPDTDAQGVYSSY